MEWQVSSVINGLTVILRNNFSRPPNAEGGSAGNGCDDTYHGPAAFSEDESANARDAILLVAERTKVYLSYHSYSQVWLTPWGYTVDLPEDYPLLVSINSFAKFNG